MYKTLFKPGDKVERVYPNAGTVKLGEKYIVKSCTKSNVTLEGFSGNYTPEYFKLVESSSVENQQVSSNENIFTEFLN